MSEAKHEEARATSHTPLRHPNDRLLAAEQALREIRSSTTYRVTAGLNRLVNAITPPGTLRRKATAKTARFMLFVGRNAASRMRALKEPRRFAAPEQPLVSVIIPIYGKWQFTRACLTALYASSTSVAFEIIVVDDRSPDASLRRLRRIKGIRVVALEENQGFVGACNAGIAAARGSFIVLLNNDTRVEPTWLDPLVERMQDPTIGLAGSRLVYPDFTLQDAGGIIFSDGSAYNYGKHLFATSHDYSYSRDVDYVTGACIIFRREALDALGGELDPRFAPAYYDDVDLAFGIRSLGLRVVYEPRSVVVHDEGISHGTDETQGVKRYQVVNQAKFVEKWATELAAQPAPGSTNIEWAARRRNPAGIVVVIDDIVPTPDTDAGSVRRFASLIALKKLGYHVILAPDSAGRPEPHTSALLAAGVEVLDPQNRTVEEIAALRDHLTAFIVARAPVAMNHLIEIRSAFPNVPVIFDTVDLHFLREIRSREVKGLPTNTPDIGFLRAVELGLMRATDLTLVVSEFEKQLLEAELPDTAIRVLSIVQAMPESGPGPEAREGILFVGSFGHKPNVDAVQWYLKEVHPLVEKELGEYPVRIVGTGAPEELEALATDSIEFCGWVADLDPLYRQARVALAPVRFGAGVKGKIGEALSHGVPMVMTSVGSEGMHLVHDETALISDDAAAFAAHVVTLVRDDDRWKRISAAGREHVDAEFGQQRFAADLEAALNAVVRP